MQKQLAAIIDSVFDEFKDSSGLVEAVEKQVDDDKDWYDIPLDEKTTPENTLETVEVAQQLGLAAFQHIDRSKGSLISENATIHGNIQFQNPEVEIHAVVNGNIDMPGGSVLLIGKRAMITGDIRCNHISIAGVVIGDIYADQVQIQETGSIQGNVTYTSAIGIATGAEICGRIQKEDRHSTRNM